VTRQEQFRELPSVDEVAGQLNIECPRSLLIAETRRAIDEARERLKAGEAADIAAIPQQVLRGIESLERPSLRRVINATGVILHTNLGRAPLGVSAAPEGYSNLEYDTASGNRGKRDVHAAALIERLTGRPGIVVNNNAAAVYLVLNELAAGHEVIVSRGELIEIGDGFRIPDIMARSGAILREIGTTNKTRLSDYRDAITERTRLILRVHPSNFSITGFTSRPAVEEIAALSGERGVAFYEDLGSGCLVDLKPYGIREPLVSDSLRAGVDVVSFSGDKLSGGPQAGIICGQPELVARIRRNPMFRALRVDKLIYSALEATLRHILFCRWDAVPALRMIGIPAERIRERAQQLRAKLSVDAEIRPGESAIGGGSTPDQSIATYLLAFHGVDAAKLERRLRGGDPPVIARIENSVTVLDLRTVFEDEEVPLATALNAALTAAAEASGELVT
jgi:L-seryl-tRNA(Ser) seleniumtransferase